MDKKYIELFTLLSRAMENIAEQVMDEHRKNEEMQQYKTAQTMRDDYAKLTDKLDAPNFQIEDLKKADYARLLVGTTVLINQIQNKIERDKQALQGYKLDILPKLDRINNTDESEVLTLAKELFTVKNND